MSSPPDQTQNIKTEKVLLGICMLGNDEALYAIVRDFDKKSFFYKLCHRHIYQTILDLVRDGEAVDALTVRQKLAEKDLLDEIGGEFYLMGLVEGTPSAENYLSHIKTHVKNWMVREYYRLSVQVQQMAIEPSADPKEIQEFASRRMLEIAQKKTGSSFHAIGKLGWDILKNIEQMQEGEKIARYATFDPELDDKIGGGIAPGFYLLAAREGIGKTTFILTLAAHMAVVNKLQVAFLSLEMRAISLAEKFYAARIDQDVNSLETGSIDSERLEILIEAIQGVEDVGLMIDDTPAQTVFEIATKAKTLKAMGKLDFLIIDCLYSIKYDQKVYGANKAAAWGDIQSALQTLSRELEIPIFLLHHLKKGSKESKFDKRPNNDDLFFIDGKIPDVIWFLHNEAKAGGLKYYTDIIELSCTSKNRFGKAPMSHLLKFVENLGIMTTLGLGRRLEYEREMEVLYSTRKKTKSAW